MSDEIIAAAVLFSPIQRNPFFINSGGDYTPRAKFLLHVTPLRQRLYPGDGSALPVQTAFLCSPGDKGKAFFPVWKILRKPVVFLHKTRHLRCNQRQWEMSYSCSRDSDLAGSSKYIQNILCFLGKEEEERRGHQASAWQPLENVPWPAGRALCRGKAA